MRQPTGRDQAAGGDGKPWLNLIPYRERLQERKPGGLEGQIWMSPDFDAADEELIAEIENSKICPGEE